MSAPKAASKRVLACVTKRALGLLSERCLGYLKSRAVFIIVETAFVLALLQWKILNG